MKKVLFTAFILSLALTACSLASDITPPPDYQPPVAQPTAAQVVYPLVPPDPSDGAAIFPEKCAPCHGDAGLGNGPQSAKLPNPPAAIGTAQVARLAKPQTWYDVVTNGRMEQSMPPFKSLSDRQRWDVIAYVLSLSTTPQEIQQGQTIYQQKCQSCHGLQGRGDGPQAATAGGKEPDWSDGSRLASRSANDLFTVITNGVAPAMPAYSSQLSEDERWAVAAYIRTLSFAGSNTIQASAATPAAASTTSATSTLATPDQNATPLATSAATLAATPSAGGTAVAQGPTSTAAPLPVGTTSAGTPVVTGKFNISGKVTFSAGGSLPSGLNVTLQGFDNMTPAWTATAPLSADGTFAFSGVDVVQNRVWMAQVEYNKVTFSSQPLHSTDVQPGKDASVAINISPSSTDVSVLKAQRLHVFFDFSTSGTLQVAELFIVQNPTDKAVVPADPANPALKFELPQGAVNLFFQDGTLGDGRYVKTDTGFGDNQTIPPQGTVQELFGYDMPYTNNTANLSVPISMPVDSAVVMVPAGGVSVSGPQVTNAGTRDVQGSGTIALFTAANLASGTKLDLTVSGVPAAQPGASGSASTPASNSPAALIIGLAVFGVVLVGGGFWLFRQRRRARAEYDEEEDEEELPAANESAESILDAIVTLDDLYQAGDLPEAAYKERRAELKERLKALRS